MIKKYGICVLLCAICCSIFSADEQGLINEMKKVYAKIAKNKIDFRNVLINDAITIKKMKLDPYLVVAQEVKALRDQLIAYLKASKEPHQAFFEALADLLRNSPDFLAIFLERDDIKAHSFVLSKTGDTLLALPLEDIAPEIRESMGKNLRIIKELKGADSRLTKQLAPLIEVIG